MKVEDLGPKLYKRATVLEPWMNIIPRDKWPIGAGLERSSFEIGRSEPTSVEETWTTIAVTEASGSCGKSFNDVYVGHLERLYKPEQFWLRGPVICQSDLTLNWNSAEFWNGYFMRMEQRNTRSIVNRLQNIYGTYSTKIYASGSGAITTVAGTTVTQPPGAALGLGGINGSLITCGLTQDILDSQVTSLILAGATSEDSGGWITNFGSGPIFPLLIGIEASNQLATNNAALREDIRYAWSGMGENALVMQRLGASRVIKNYRHVPTATPPRWSQTGGVLTRISPWVMSTASANATKGQVAITNPNYTNPSVASVEAAILMTPFVMTEEILQPVTSVSGATFPVQNYYGDWKFVTGNDAFLGMDDCAGIADPLHEQGRHFAVYKHALKPVFPDFGRVFLFLRCPDSGIDCLSCS